MEDSKKKGCSFLPGPAGVSEDSHISRSYFQNCHLHFCVLDAAIVVDVDSGEDTARDEGEEGVEDALGVVFVFWFYWWWWRKEGMM